MESTSTSKITKTKKNIIALKYLIKTFKITKFDINSYNSDMKFVNVKVDAADKKSDNNLKKKITKLIEQRKHKDEILIPPTEYYDEKLNLVEECFLFLVIP